MASVLPKTKIARIEWVEARIEEWLASPTLIGLTLSECQALNTKVKAARASYDEATKARARSKDATVSSDNDAAGMTALASTAIKHIKAYAASSANPDAVYAAASVPPPAAPGPAQAPARPSDFTFELDPNSGGLIVRWKCTNPAGVSRVSYTVRRGIGNGAMTTAGVVGEKKFTDTTIPAGASVVNYQVYGQLGTLVGTASNIVTVRFGGGGMQVSEAAAPADVKLAA